MKMLEPQRVFSLIPKRKGMPKLKNPRAESFIQADTDQALVKIEMRAGDPSVSVERTGPNTIEIQHHHPPYRPISAIRSVLRSAWMIMSPQARRQHPIVLSTARGEDLVLPLEFFSFFLPGNTLAQVALSIYEKKTALPGSDLVISLTVANTTLVWCAPGPGKSYGPTLLPPFETLPPEFLTPTGALFKCSADDAVRVENAKMCIQFEQTHDGPPLNTPVKSVVKKPRPEVVVRLEVKAGGQTLAALQSNCTPLRFDEKASRILLHGGELNGSIAVHQDYPAGLPKLECKMDFTSVSVISAKKTLDFFDHLRVKDAVLHVVGPQEQVLARLDGFAALGPKKDWKLLSWLVKISEEFMLELPFPAKALSSEELRQVEILAEGIVHGRVRWENGAPITVRSGVQLAPGLMDILKEGKDLAFHGINPFNICGVAIDAGPYRLILEKPVPTKPIAELEAEIATRKDGDELPIELKADAIRYEFDKWIKEER